MHHPRNQCECVLVRLSAAEQHDVGLQPLAQLVDVVDRRLADERLMAESRDDFRKPLQPLARLVCDRDATRRTLDGIGPREGRKGIGVGAVLGAVAAVASGGLTLLEGAALGSAGGGLVGSLFRRGLMLSGDDAERINSRLEAGHAAVGVLVPPNQAAAISAELEALGGEPEVHEVPLEDLAAAAPSAGPTSL